MEVKNDTCDVKSGNMDVESAVKTVEVDKSESTPGISNLAPSNENTVASSSKITVNPCPEIEEVHPLNSKSSEQTSPIQHMSNVEELVCPNTPESNISLEQPSKVTLKRKSDSLALISSYEISSDSENDTNTEAFMKIRQDKFDVFDSESETDSESGSIFNVESDASGEMSGTSTEDEEGGAAEGGGGGTSSDQLLASSADKVPAKNKPGKTASSSSSSNNKLLGCLDGLDGGELPPIKDLQITVKEEECLPFGKVHSIVETLVVIESLPDVPALNLDSVLFTKSGEPLGEVFDVFGPVKRPYYTLRFKSRADIQSKALSIGTLVYCAPKTKYTQYVFIHQLAKMKGSDASWKNDIEPPPECLDYSDDEQERLAKKAIREAKQRAKASKVIDVDAPPKKITSFEERMNQRNTLKSQMFIRDPPTSCRSRSNDWFNYRHFGNSRTEESSATAPIQPQVSSNSSGGGLLRNSVLNPNFVVNQQQRGHPPPPNHQSGGGFQPFETNNPGGAFSRFIPHSFTPTNRPPTFWRTEPTSYINNSFNNSFPRPIGTPPTSGHGPIMRPPHHHQPPMGGPPSLNFNNQPPTNFLFDRQSSFQQPPFLQNHHPPPPPQQFSSTTPNFNYPPPIFPPQQNNQPGGSSSHRPLPPISPPYFNSPPPPPTFARLPPPPPNHHPLNPHHSQNMNYTTNNRFATTFSPFQHYNQN